jgi:hypothetical protein
MKLPDHVDLIRSLIHKSFDNLFARLGLGAKKTIDMDKIPTESHDKRNKIGILIESHTGETGSYETARAKALDELTFTLFNRIAAIKVMEARQLFPPIITKQAEHGDRSFGHKVWLEENPTMRSEELEGLRDYLKYEFTKLGLTIPLYNKDYPYALLPYIIDLNEIIDAFNAVENDTSIEDDIWQSDDILGWLYESYNNYKKIAHKESKAKTEYNKVSIQSQVYTPRWVVEFLVHNSLGKLYLEMYPDSEIKGRYQIANPPKTKVRDKKDLHKIKLIDPASGSGNFLLYAFDFFYELYLDQIESYGADYEEDDIPKLIIEHNLHGIDLDNRAIQLAQLGLWIKAKQKRRNLGSLKFNVVSSDFFLPDFEKVYPLFKDGIDGAGQKQLVEDIWEDLQQAYKFGSLIKIEEKINLKLQSELQKNDKNQISLFDGNTIQKYEAFSKDFFNNLEIAVAKYAQQQGNTFLTDKTKEAITFLKLLNQKYDVATANPPYTDSADFGPDLKEFIQANYKKPFKFHTNLYATFIKRCFELSSKKGKIAMIHPRTFMFIKTFEDVRKFILEKTHINVFVDFGYGNIFGSIHADPVFYVFEKEISHLGKAWFVSLDQYTRTSKEKLKQEFAIRALNDFISNRKNIHNYSILQSKLKNINTWPFIYWISDEFRQQFTQDSVKDILKNCQGLATANNNRFLRFWWELALNNNDIRSKKWISYAKGGRYQKWAGNLWLKVLWENNGFSIRNFTDTNGKQRSRPQNENVYFKEGITYSASGQKGPSYRFLPKGSIFDVGGSSIFPIKKFKNNYYILAFFNSKLSKYVIECLNPTVNKQVGDIERIPFTNPKTELEKIITDLSIDNVNIVNNVNSYKIVEPEYSQSPLNCFFSSSIKKILSDFLNSENWLISKIIVNESIINEKIIDVYNLEEEDKAMVLVKEGESIGSLSVSPKAKQAYLANEEKLFRLDNIKGYIKQLPEKKFTEEEQAVVVEDFPNLYKSNNNLEEFCIRHQINPINIWYWFKESNVIPEHRMNDLAMEFLADMIREILMEDEDGIIPLVPNAGEEVLLDRIEIKFREKGFSMAQYSSFDKVLGCELNSYINKYFFSDLSDYLNLFMYLPKTPFIWHLTSGPEQGFDCYIIIYKWNRDKLMSIKSIYIEKRERALINRQSDLANDSSAKAQNEKDTIYKQLKEIEVFKQKIANLLAEGYDPILDDGVGKNIAPLQAKGMLAYEVLNKSQLKKYLNADW